MATLLYLLWRFDPRQVWLEISQVGLGMLLIVPFQIFDHMLNALGWRFCFSAEDAPDVPFWRLVYVRIAGDGVNYLTPSGTIAGELIRPGLLGPVKSDEVKNSSVAVAKFAQALGQALFILLGMVFVLQGQLDLLQGRQKILGYAGTVTVIFFVSLTMVLLTRRRADGTFYWPLKGNPGAMRARMRDYLDMHPGRFALATACFVLGYAWGAAEVMLICHFLGHPLPLVTCLAVETLSNVVDSLMFMVPAKLGTQEAGKTAIFAGLGLPASQGLALGIIRHTRELLWAGAGFIMYAVHQRRRYPPPPGGPLPEPGSASSEDSAASQAR